MAKVKRTKQQMPAGASIENITRRIVIWGAFLSLVIISPAGRETFRVPKDLLLRTEAILILAVAIAGVIAGALTLRRIPWKAPAIGLTALATAWAIVTSFLSTNRPLSALSLLTIIPAAIIFVATFFIARGRGVELLTPLLWAGGLNCALYLSQFTGIFNPIEFTAAFTGRNAATGFLGNANDLGSTLIPIAVAAAALAFTDAARRMRYQLVAALIVLTIFVSVSMAAIGAVVLALAAMTLLVDWRKTVVTLVGVAIVGAIAVAAYQPFRLRVSDIAHATKQRSFDRLLSGRLASFSSAAKMLADHPVTGTGPGTFGWNYLPYKIEVTEANPERFRDTAAVGFNFEEVHNDHLEVLAETGIPGYAILIASLAYLAMGSFRRRGDGESESSPEQRWVRLTSLPLAVGLFVLALAQYPLQLASSISSTLFVAALCVAWLGTSASEEASSEATPRARFGTAGTVAITVVVSAVPIWNLAVVPWHCNVMTKSMESAMRESLRGNADAKAFLVATLEDAERCRAHVRHDQSLNVAIASTYSTTGRPDEALAVYEDALRYDRRPEIYFNIGGIYLKTGYSEKAFDNFLIAARFNPVLADRINGDTMKSRVKYELARRQKQ